MEFAIMRGNYLAGNFSPELLDEGNMLGPLQEIHWHAIQESSATCPSWQADVQLMQMFGAILCPQTSLYLSWLGKTCSIQFLNKD